MASRAIKGRHNVKKKNGPALLFAVFGCLIAIFLALAGGAIALANTWLEDLPDYTNPDAMNTSATSTVYASDGTTVLAEFQLENREPVEYDAISEYVINCTVATEDERFYSHAGVDLYGTMRALVNNVLGGNTEGGSTITQQLVRNTILSEEAAEISFKRKVREVYIATKIEQQYTKDEILLMYLNTINYGSGAYGIEAAAERYYSKHANELTLAEAATLVGIPQSPTYNNPIDYPENCRNRRNLVLDRMVSNGYLTSEEAEAAKAEEIVLNPTKQSTTGIVAYPYFTSYVRNQLLNEDGKYAFSAAELFQGGLEITTTLDLGLQTAAEIAADEKLKQAGSKFEVAMASIDPNNGHINALIGGKDYDVSQVNMATGEGSSGRQCGSSFKTYTLCAAIESGINPSTNIDAGKSVKLEGTDAYVYNSNRGSYGTIPIKRAFAVSSNTAFTRLIMSVGIDKVKDMAQRLGVKSKISDVAGITLGIDSVTPLEMASAYSTIANGGTYYEPECILTIKDRNGNVIIDNTNPTGERVISKEVAGATIEVMKGVISGGTGTAAALSTGQVAAGKTGTTDDSKDSWFVGFTPQLCAAFWLGERAESYDKAAVVPVTVASAFGRYMSLALANAEIESFFKADDPYYRSSYYDAKNHVGGSYWSSADDEEEDSSSSSSSSAGTEGGSSAGTTGSGGAGGHDPSEGGDEPGGSASDPDPGPAPEPEEV